MTQTIIFNNIGGFIGSCFLVYGHSFLENSAFIFFVWFQIAKQIQYMMIYTLVVSIVFFPFYFIAYALLKIVLRMQMIRNGFGKIKKNLRAVWVFGVRNEQKRSDEVS